MVISEQYISRNQAISYPIIIWSPTWHLSGTADETHKTSVGIVGLHAEVTRGYVYIRMWRHPFSRRFST